MAFPFEWTRRCGRGSRLIGPHRHQAARRCALEATVLGWWLRRQEVAVEPFGTFSILGVAIAEERNEGAKERPKGGKGRLDAESVKN